MFIDLNLLKSELKSATSSGKVAAPELDWESVSRVVPLLSLIFPFMFVFPLDVSVKLPDWAHN